MTERPDVYQIVTDRMLALLSQGVAPWRKPWRAVGADANGPANYVSNRAYSGVNSWLLWGEALAKGYESRYWATFNQVRELGGKVRKGEKATPVVFWRILSKRVKDADTGSVEEKKVFFLRYYNVFNLSQTEGCREIKRGETVTDVVHDPIEAAEEISSEYFARESLPLMAGSAAFYRFDDSITMPPLASFNKAEEYYSTLFHEMIHSTGHSKRLDRFSNESGHGMFGSESYSKEELVAEMGSAFLCSHANILQATEGNNAAYLHGWMKKLESDPKLIVHAAAQAEKATRYVLTGSKAVPGQEGDKAEEAQEETVNA